MVMMSLFSVFDPTSFMGLSMNWMVLLLVYLYLPYNYYTLNKGFKSMWMSLGLKVKEMFYEVSFPNGMMLVYMCMVIFVYLIMSNLLGLFPYIFTSTAHPMFTLGVGVVMWLSFVLMGWIKSLVHSAAHLVPEGSPLVLSPFLVLVEMVSHLIRPFTLSIRLAANMMAGHLILGLLSSISVMGLFSGVVSLILQGMMLMLEFGVAVIQGFVFSILLLLYALEYH